MKSVKLLSIRPIPRPVPTDTNSVALAGTILRIMHYNEKNLTGDQTAAHG